MNILIIEDEPISANELISQINKAIPQAMIHPVLDTIADTVQFLQNTNPDLIFLDIELADGSAFQIFDQVEIDCPIIFTTAYNEYALQAFEVNSVDYLLKPITREKVARAFERFDKMKDAFPKENMLELIRKIGSGTTSHPYKESFLVKSGKRLFPIQSQDISYFFAEEKWVCLVKIEGKQHIINYTLTQLEELLDPNIFFRLNRQYIVSRGMIDSLEGYVKGQVMAHLKKGLPPQVVSRKQTRLLKAWLS